MRIISTSIWDIKFFEKFMNFRNKIHQNLSTSFPEDLTDYEKYFGHDSPFLNDYRWEAFQVIVEEKVMAKAILTWRKDSTVGNLGFIDWENDPQSAQELIKCVTACARRQGLKKLKTPVDLNLYLKYRIRLPGGKKPFWGEPVYPDYYHELFQATGFKEIARWDTYQLSKAQGILDYFLKRKKLARKEARIKKTSEKFSPTTVRCISLKNWERDLKIIHQLFNEAYQSMPEWEPITFEQFRLIYDDFRYIMNPWFSFIVEMKGVPVGFSINFVDPLPVLSKVKGKKLSTPGKLWLLLKLRLNTSKFLIAHVGKIPGPNGEEVKGVQIKVSRRIQVISLFMRQVLVSFQIKDSPSRRSFDEKYQTLYAQYVLYGMDLE